MRTLNRVLVVLFTIVGIAIAMLVLIPVNQVDREPAWRVRCASNLRQIGTGIALYANEHGGAFPDSFVTLIRSEDLLPENFTCPQGDTQAAKNVDTFVDSTIDCDYVYVGDGLTNAATEDTIIAFERPLNHDGDGINVLFGDGHVDFMTSRNLKPRADQRHEDDWWTAVQDQAAKHVRPIRLPATTTAKTS